MEFQDALTGLNNNTAKDIDLSQQPLSQQQIVELCTTLATNVSLQRLNLEEVGLTAQGAGLLAKALSHHRSIQQLIVDENPLGEKGVEAIIALFSNHSTLYKVSASDIGASKPQRNTLKQLNKQHKSRKPKSTTAASSQTQGTSNNTLLENMIATYYDRAWQGQQVMADPVFYPKDGKLYERERLMAHEKSLSDEITLSTSITLQQQIHAYLKQAPHLWHEPDTGVYLPQAWKKAVLTAIKSGDSNTLQTYWEKHPGLVTTGYVLDNRRVKLHQLLIAQGKKADFSQWLEHYSQYTQYDTVPALTALFSTVEENGHHVFHHLIQHKREPGWYTPIPQELKISGDAYHGLVHLHSKATTTADTVAINTLLERICIL